MESFIVAVSDQVIQVTGFVDNAEKTEGNRYLIQECDRQRLQIIRADQ